MNALNLPQFQTRKVFFQTLLIYKSSQLVNQRTEVLHYSIRELNSPKN